MRLCEALHILPGVIAIIGGGGKTTLQLRLAEELKAQGRVIVCATAKIYPPIGIPTLLSPDADEITAALQTHRVLCVGREESEGKLTLPLSEISILTGLADYVLVEADGSKGLPLKAHAPHEPVIPQEAAQRILVMGIDGVGRPIREAAHRPQLYADILGTGLDHIITARDAAYVAAAEKLHDLIFINKVETAMQHAQAKELAANVTCPIVAGALQKEGELCLL